jgi:hypothetical protein
MKLESFKNQDWFDSVGIDEYNRDIVYVHYMNLDIIKYIQSCVGNVLIHFTDSKINKEKYVKLVEIDPITDRDPSTTLLRIIGSLQEEYPQNIIQDIFFEIHDGENSLTNFSVTFSNLRSELEDLYNVYGFDVIYDYLG